MPVMVIVPEWMYLTHVGDTIHTTLTTHAMVCDDGNEAGGATHASLTIDTIIMLFSDARDECADCIECSWFDDDDCNGCLVPVG